MRILHVVTLVDDDGTYGGPLAAAIGQCQELRRRGHDARLVAGWRGEGATPTQLEGVPAHLFPVRSLIPGGSVAPGRSPSKAFSLSLSAWLRRQGEHFDVAHLHFSRDVIPVSAASLLDRAGVPYVVQTHGKVGPATTTSARLADSLGALTALRKAARRLVADPHERTTIADVTGSPSGISLLPHGVPLPAPVSRSPLAHGTLDVLTMSRLHPSKGILSFARVAAQLIESGLDARFCVVGPDGGQRGELLAFIAANPQLRGRLQYEGGLSHELALERIRRADLFVAPSGDGTQSTAMLEALATGIPTICTTAFSHAILLRARRGSRVVKPTEEALAQGIRELAADPVGRVELGRRGRVAAAQAFDIAMVVDELLGVYESVLEGSLASRAFPASWAGEAGPAYAAPASPVSLFAGTDRPGPSEPSGAEQVGGLDGLREMFARDDALDTDLDAASLPAPRSQRDQAQDDDLDADVAATAGVEDAQDLLWVTTEVTPYRLALWREIGQNAELTVALLDQTRANSRLQLESPREPFQVVQVPAARRGSDDDARGSRPAVSEDARDEPAKALRTQIRRRPDAVVIDGYESPAFQTAARWARRYGVPVVASYRSARSTPTSVSGAVARVQRRLLQHADAVIASGARDGEELRRLGVPAERIMLGSRVPGQPRSYPGDPATVRPATSGPASARPATAKPPTATPATSRPVASQPVPIVQQATGNGVLDLRGHHFLFLGQLVERKNLDALLEAFEQMRGPEDRLTIAGSGPLSGALGRRVQELVLGDSVELCGPLEGDPRLSELSQSHTLVLPSLEEVWGIEVDEALDAGLHVVVTTGCGVAHSVAGLPTVFVAQPTPVSLARAMSLSRERWTGRRRPSPQNQANRVAGRLGLAGNNGRVVDLSDQPSGRARV